MAHHDFVTGLPNRIFLSERLRQEIARARRGDRRFALHMIDLDGFKAVNDVMGHSIGDQLLAAVAARLLTVKQYGYVVARLGGDEFAVLQTNLSDNEAAAGLAIEVCAHNLSKLSVAATTSTFLPQPIAMAATCWSLAINSSNCVAAIGLPQ
jgi:diguanylate cyclase (GGDEF)-like protein